MKVPPHLRNCTCKSISSCLVSVVLKNIVNQFFQNYQRKTGSVKKIDRVQLVYNETLEDAYERKKAEFKLKGIPSDEILAFHGTPESNISSILQTNLQYLVTAGILR